MAISTVMRLLSASASSGSATAVRAMKTPPAMMTAMAAHCTALGRTPISTFTTSTSAGCAATIGTTTAIGPRAMPM